MRAGHFRSPPSPSLSTFRSSTSVKVVAAAGQTTEQKLGDFYTTFNIDVSNP